MSVIRFTVHSVLVSNIFYVIRFHLLVPRHCTVSSHAVVPSTCHSADNLKINGDCVRCQPCQRHPQIKHCLSEFGLQCRLHRTVVSDKNLCGTKRLPSVSRPFNEACVFLNGVFPDVHKRGPCLPQVFF